MTNSPSVDMVVATVELVNVHMRRPTELNNAVRQGRRDGLRVMDAVDVLYSSTATARRLGIMKSCASARDRKPALGIGPEQGHVIVVTFERLVDA